jgi:hypothetical protein
MEMGISTTFTVSLKMPMTNYKFSRKPLTWSVSFDLDSGVYLVGLKHAHQDAAVCSRRLEKLGAFVSLFDDRILDELWIEELETSELPSPDELLSEPLQIGFVVFVR